MRDKVLRIKLIILAVIILALLGTVVFCHNTRTLEYTIDEYYCRALFDCTPEEFLNKEMPFYEETGDLREKSFVKDGQLVLVFTEKQAKLFGVSDWILNCSEVEEFSDIKISDDLKTLTLYVSSGFDINAKITEINKVIAKITLRMLLSGKNEDEIVLTVVIKDRITGMTIADDELPYGTLLE